MSTDGGGIVRSSYIFNPVLVNAAAGNAAGNTRAYQKSSQAKSRNVFMTDYLENPTGAGTPGIPFNSQNWAHWPSHGLTTTFNDGSISFVSSQPAFILATTTLITDESITSLTQYQTIFTDLLNTP